LVVLPAAAAGDVPEYFYAGADDCLTWPSSTEHLAARVFALVRRGRYTYDDRSDYRLEVDPNAGNVTIDGAAFALKGKRFDIFVYLAQNRDRWVKSEELLKNVFETHHRSDTSLVRVHVHRLKRSLGALGWLVQSEERRGYRISFQKRAA
jgi:DNA-binding response OmpR family regulator